jgi:membrane fusion protein (multidrug efflux system)
MKKIFIYLSIAASVIVTSCGKSETTDNAQLETDISPVIPKINSTVSKVLVEDNQAVKQGDTLVLLDDAMYKIAVQQAEIAVLQAQQNVNLSSSNKGVASSGVSSVSANLGAARAGVDAAKVRYELASKNYQRFKNLLDQKSATQQQFDGIKAEKETAEKLLKIAEGALFALQKQVETSQAGVTSSSAGIELAKISVKQAEANLASAKLQLSYCTILAPADGIVSKKNVQNGQVVSIGQPLMAITNNNKIWVVANFKETQIEKMKIGQEAEIEVDAFEGEPLKGKVQSFSQATGSKFSLLPADNATGNFVKVTQRIPVKIVLTDKNNATNLRAGMSVVVKVITE